MALKRYARDIRSCCGSGGTASASYPILVQGAGVQLALEETPPAYEPRLSESCSEANQNVDRECEELNSP